MCGGGVLPQGIDHGGKSHIPKGGAESLEHVGKGNPHTGTQNLQIGKEPFSPGRDARMPPQHKGDTDAACGECGGAGDGGSDHSKSCAPECKIQGKEGDFPDRIDEEKIQRHIDQVDKNTYFHRRFGIPCRAQYGAENDAGSPGQHGQIQNQEILGGHGPDGRLHLHPHRHQTA